MAPIPQRRRRLDAARVAAKRPSSGSVQTLLDTRHAVGDDQGDVIYR